MSYMKTGQVLSAVDFGSANGPTKKLKKGPQLTFACWKSTIEAKEKSEICSKLTIKTSDRRHWRRSSFFVDNFEHISHHFSVRIVDFEQENVTGKWEMRNGTAALYRKMSVVVSLILPENRKPKIFWCFQGV